MVYIEKKRSLPGPTFVLPFLGNAVSLVRDPTRFWNLQSETARSSPHGISANYVLGKFIAFVRDTDLSHKIDPTPSLSSDTPSEKSSSVNKTSSTSPTRLTESSLNLRRIAADYSPPPP